MVELEVFSKKHRVLNVSLRHYFPELWDGAGSDFSCVQHAHDVGAFIQQLSIGPVHLLGHSRGGAVAIEVAKKYPSLIRTLILEDAAARLELADTDEKTIAFRSKLFADFRQDVAEGNLEDGMARFIDGMGGPGSWKSMTTDRQKRFLQNAWTALVEDPLPLTGDDELRKFNFPVLLLTGEKSPPMYGLLIAEMQIRGNFKPPVIIPGVGHGMNAQDPKAVSETVLNFTTEH